MIKKEFTCTISKKLLPCLWESGGGKSNTGSSQIICGKRFEVLQAIYINQRGNLTCGNHALIPIEVGCHIIITEHQRKDFNVDVFVISNILDSTVYCKLVCSLSQGEFDEVGYELMSNQYFIDAINASIYKSEEYHCRKHFYAIKPAKLISSIV